MGALRDELAKLLDPDGLRALSDVRGGREARISKRVPPGHWLERAVGRELRGGWRGATEAAGSTFRCGRLRQDATGRS